LIISVENERFAIPQTNIEELLRVRPEDLKNRIEIVGDCEVLLLRDRMLPLARCAEVIGALPSYADTATRGREFDRRTLLADRRSPRHPLVKPDDRPAPATAGVDPLSRRTADDRRQAAASALEIAVVTTGMMSFGLVVGGFHDTEEVVVKPLGRRLKHLREYSGATILGDGTVALILDVAGLAAKAGLTSVSGSARAAELAAEAEVQRLQDVHSLLLFHNGPSEPCAIPLDLVQRIEHIRPEQVERLGHHRTMQYRGSSLPLVTLADAANVGSMDAEQDLVVLVSSTNGHEVGLLGTMPVDVIETRAAIDQSTHRQNGITGSAIILDRTTLIVDLYEVVDAVHPDWGTARADLRVATAAHVGGAATVLLAEDSDFFRAQVKKYLEEDGFHVLAAPDGEAAWELLLKNHEKVSVVVTDIEMPRLTGLGLAARIRADERTAGLPVIAVTSLAGDEDIARGKAAGINEYQIKLDRDTLLSSVHGMLDAQRVTVGSP
jgi:two-component system chemotaxis sensor kinase CheA